MGRRRRLIVIGGAVLLAACVVVAVVVTQRQSTISAVGDASAGTIVGTAAESAPTTTAPSETPSPGAARRLDRSGLAALTLTSSDLAAAEAGVSTKAGVKKSFVTLQEYRAGYKSTTDPSSCAVARGLMEFTDTDGPASADWNRPSILREENLRLVSSSQTGSQQIRQFRSDAAAIAFMERQRAWFAECGHVVFSWKGSSATVSYDGAIVEQQGSDELLARGAIGGLSSGATSEFDSWVRRGSIVYASYLLGDASTPPTDLDSAGRAVATAVAAKLEAAGAA